MAELLLPPLTETTAAPPPRRRMRKSPSLQLSTDTREKIVAHVLQTLQEDINDRADWMEMRLQRYGKYRGWLEDETGPWPDAISPHIPVILWNCLRLQAQLHNAVLSIRPVMGAQAQQPHNVSKQDTIDQLLDWQIFIEAGGAKKLDDFIQGFVEDGPTVAHVPWVHETRTIHDVRTFPAKEKGLPDAGLPPTGDESLYLAACLRLIFPEGTIATLGREDLRFRVDAIDEETKLPYSARVTVADREGTDAGYEIHIEREATVYDGPVINVEDLEDLVVPWRSANLQPPGPANPRGARHVRRLRGVRLDELKRHVKSGTYDLIRLSDLEDLDDTGSPATPGDQIGHDIDRPKQQKDEIEGVTKVLGGADAFTMIESYDRWDVNGDGLEEDVIFWVLKEKRLLCRARYLTEIYPTGPGLLPRRPFAETCLIPVKNRWYGMGMIELLEHLSDLINGVFRMNLQWGQITNSPYGFYDPASGIKPETIPLWPGELYPVPSPRENLYFPQLPNQDQAWAFNMGTILMQMVERLSMQSGPQYGQVPQGKATAFRTMGTTAALLQQADIRADQILLRLFEGIAEIYTQIHALNQRYLRPEKQVRLVGIPASEAQQAYKTISPSQVAGRYDFRWKATLTNADKTLLPQILLEIASVIISPLAFQMGWVDPEKGYALLREYIKARHQDPDKFLARPPDFSEEPGLLAEEAISALLEGNYPTGRPLEGPEAHLQKLQAFAQSDNFGFLDQVATRLFQKYALSIRHALMRQVQQQQMMQAMAQFQAMAQQQLAGGAPPGASMAAPPGLAGNPPLESREFLAEDLIGAGGGQNG